MELCPPMKTPHDVEAAFYAAFRSLDAAGMQNLWSSSTQIFCVHPGGALLTGSEAVFGSWLQIFAAADPPQLEYRLLHSWQGEELAVHLVEERIQPSRGKTGGSALVVATNVYAAVRGDWRMLSHHASLPMGLPPDSREPRQVH
jgi:hypothetical protein